LGRVDVPEKYFKYVGAAVKDIRVHDVSESR